MMATEKPFERLQSLEQKINEVDKIQTIENYIAQLKERIWAVKEVLTTAEASAYLGLSESYIYKLTSLKQIPHYKPNGKLVYFNRKELCEWAMRNQVQTIKKVQEYMTADLRNHYTLQELSEKFEIPLTSMKVCFKGVYGCSIYAYMKSYRMQAATILLRDTSDSITEIAAKMGYDNPSKFSEVFKKEFGELPSEFRKKLSK